MKKLLTLVFSISLLFAQPVFATSSSGLSLSDAVYADLALRHNLNNVSIYYANNKTAEDIKLNESRHWLPASTVKTFTAMYAYKRIAERKLHLYDSVAIESKNTVPTELVTDELPALSEGDSITIDRLIRQMITQSDNTAYNVLLDILGRDTITNYIQSLGLTHSRVGSKLNLDTSQEQFEFDVRGYGINTTTAEDYAKAFLFIKENKIAGAKELFSVLKDQKINTMIPLLLPKEVTCAHKTGDLDPLYHDGGICQDKKQSYVLTIFTNAGDTNLLAHLSELIYTKNFNLVGESFEKKTFGQAEQEDHPLDTLVMNQPRPFVLGTNTTSNFSIPITAADLGVTAKDLSLVIKDKDLPRIVIPADSSFHFLSDTWQRLKKIFVFLPKARQDVDLETARLRLAEAKDLVKRGETKEAEVVLQNLHQGLASLAKNTTVANDSSVQNAIQAVSETRFAILSDELKQVKGDEKLVLIKDIANQAKATVQNIQPNIPNATNATNPSQKPFIGEIVNANSTQITIKTAGGQKITIPTNDTSIALKDKTVALTQNPSSPTPSTSPSLRSLAVGTTVALIGSTANNNRFSPTLILTNIPRELAAPQPVTVAKVDLKHNTMVVIENGIYTQVNINENTRIKGADTNIPLKEIKPGDVVIVHGEPLAPVIPINNQSPTQNLPKTIAPQTVNTIINVTPSKLPVSPQKGNTSHGISTTTSPQSPIVTVAVQKESTKQSPSVQTIQPQPKVIQSTSIKLIEKKEDAAKPPAPAASAQTTQQKPKENNFPNQKQQPVNKPQPVQSSSQMQKEDSEKKK